MFPTMLTLPRWLFGDYSHGLAAVNRDPPHRTASFYYRAIEKTPLPSGVGSGFVLLPPDVKRRISLPSGLTRQISVLGLCNRRYKIVVHEIHLSGWFPHHLLSPIVPND